VSNICSLERVCEKYLFDPYMKMFLGLMHKLLTNFQFVPIFFSPCKLAFYLNATVLFDYLMPFS